MDAAALRRLCEQMKDGARCRLWEGHRDQHENWYGERWDDGDVIHADMREAEPARRRAQAPAPTEG